MIRRPSCGRMWCPDKVASRTLGVPERLLTEVGLKVSGPKNSATEAGDENKP